jgi:hypothetical protein
MAFLVPGARPVLSACLFTANGKNSIACDHFGAYWVSVLAIGQSRTTDPYCSSVERQTPQHRRERPAIMFRKLLLSAALLASFSGMAMAEGGDTNIEQFMASQPHGPGISNGIPVIVDNQDGQPVIAYRGATSQGWGAGIATIVDNQDGQPVIRYEQGSNGGSALAEANNGQSPVQVN